jgi:hypothetical protein
MADTEMQIPISQVGTVFVPVADRDVDGNRFLIVEAS